MTTRKQMDLLGLMLYCQNIVDALLGFLRREEVKKLEEKMKSAADLMVWLGAEFAPEFKETVNGWRKSGEKWPSYGYGDLETRLCHECYLVFEKTVKNGGYKNRLVEIRRNLLSLINPDPAIDFSNQKENAEVCLDFFSNLLGACHYAFKREYFDH
jgi:hypothetical protein